MADENLRIDQLDLGEPTPSDYGVYRDMASFKTKRFSMGQFITSPTTNDIEWTSAKAVAGDYDINSIVTRGGTIWQSTINNNPNVPGSEDVGLETWIELTRGKSGFVIWEAGTFLEDEVFVINVMPTGGYYLFRLAAAARPYVSADFTAELSAGDWEVFGKLELIEVDTSGADINLNFYNLVGMSFKGSEIIDGNTNIHMINDAFALTIPFFRFSVDAPGRQLTFDADVKHLKGSGDWDAPDGFVWSAPDVGTYDLFATHADNIWQVIIFGPF